MSDKPPTNKWRVRIDDGDPKGFRSENKAYEYVREHLPSGKRIVVRQWEYGDRWVLYEVFDERPPDDTPGAAERRMADN